jgi:hypothetical protein
MESLSRQRDASLINNSGHRQSYQLYIRVNGKGRITDIAHIFHTDLGLDTDFIKGNIIMLIVNSGGQKKMVVIADQGNGQNLNMRLKLLL